jgi:hypothetical protein
MSQRDASAEVQFELVKHATQVFVASLHTGVLPVHSPLHGCVVALELAPAVPPSLDEPLSPAVPPAEAD